MDGPKTGSGGGPTVPTSDRRLVQSLKEFVPNSEDEIYAMLKECNMDLNETAQRLLSEDTFHVVRRKRDKKKENTNTKEVSDSRSRPINVATPNRGLKNGGVAEQGAGTGSSLPRFNPIELSSGRGKPQPARENGVYPCPQGPTPVSTNAAHTQPYGQPKGSSIAASGCVPSSTALSNGSSLQPRPSLGLQGTWVAGSGHATLADILKSNGSQITQTPRVSLPGSVQATSTSQQKVSSVPSISSDLVLNPSLDPCAPIPGESMKCDVGTVGNQRPIGDRSSSFSPLDANLLSSPESQHVQLSQTKSASATSNDMGSDLNLLQHNDLSFSASTIYLDDQTRNLESASTSPDHSGGVASSSTFSGLSASQGMFGGSQFTSVPVDQAQQQPVNAQKVTDTGMDWQLNQSTQNGLSQAKTGESSVLSVVADAFSLPPSPPSPETRILTAAAVQLQELNLQDDQPVIIPDHLRVSKADSTRLNFGSFGTGFETAFSTSFSSEESKSSFLSNGDSIPVTEATVSEQPLALSDVRITSSSLNHQHQQPSASADENLVPSTDVTVPSAPVTTVSQSELAKPEAVVRQSPQHPYLSAVPSYHGFNLVPQMHGGQYQTEQNESRPQDASRLSNSLKMQQSYSDPITNYYNGAFRLRSEGDVHYPAFLASAAGNGKYSGSMPAVTGQSTSFLESGIVVLPTSSSLSQTTHSSNGQMAMTVPHQSLPIHGYTAQPSSLPLGPFANVFSYQYVPPSFTFLPSPYQHNYASNSGYHQSPTASSYSLGGATSIKYSMPQYKPGASAGAGLHSSVGTGTVGYGGYNSQLGTYAVNPTVSAGGATGYNDVVAPQYKDNSVYGPSQQVDGSAVWVQAQLSRDMPGLQASLYYNIQGQSQQCAYSRTQQPSHVHAHPAAAYGSLYHSQLSGPSQSTNQLLQQSQVLGAGGSVGVQVGSYQQSQRAQQTWTSNF